MVSVESEKTKDLRMPGKRKLKNIFISLMRFKDIKIRMRVFLSHCRHAGIDFFIVKFRSQLNKRINQACNSLFIVAYCFDQINYRAYVIHFLCIQLNDMLSTMYKKRKRVQHRTSKRVFKQLFSKVNGVMQCIAVAEPLRSNSRTHGNEASLFGFIFHATYFK